MVRVSCDVDSNNRQALTFGTILLERVERTVRHPQALLLAPTRSGGAG